MKVLKVRTLWGWYGIPIKAMIDYCIEKDSGFLSDVEALEARESYSNEDDNYGELLDDFLSNSDWDDLENMAIKLPDDPLPEINNYDNDWFEYHPESKGELYKIIEIKEA